LLFVTARPHMGPIQNWLMELLGQTSNAIEVVTTGSHTNKTEVLLNRKISCFVEDRLDTCDLVNDAGILPVLYRQPWNRLPHPYQEIDSWQELEALIDF